MATPRQRYIVKPYYFPSTEVGTTRLYLVYDTLNQRYETLKCETFLIPNYSLKGRGKTNEDLRKWFDSISVAYQEWRVTPPIFADPADLQPLIDKAHAIG
jgi:hypothetical protein